MGQSDLHIRIAALEDAAALQRIYAPYVEQTAITFEVLPPDVPAFRARIARTLERYPFLVAERDGLLLGYAYTGRFMDRAAYDWAAEPSIYLLPDQRRQGVGKALYTALETLSKAQNVQLLCARVACPAQEDCRLTQDSLRFHLGIGYHLAGMIRQCGYKFGTWYHLALLEKSLGERPANPLPFLPFPALGFDVLLGAGIEAAD